MDHIQEKRVSARDWTRRLARDGMTFCQEHSLSRLEHAADQMELNIIYVVRNVFRRTRILMKESLWIVHAEAKRGVASWWIYASFWVCFF